jgi:hypothetical protein
LLFVVATQTVMQSSKWQSGMARKSLKIKNITQLSLTWCWWSCWIPGRDQFLPPGPELREKYTLSQSGRELLRNLDDVVYVKIYLDGDLPAEFVNFRKSIRELMDEFRAYGEEKVQYEFINLYEEQDEALRNRMIGDLYERGLNVTNIQARDGEGGSSARIIFPGAMISYRGRRCR